MHSAKIRSSSRRSLRFDLSAGAVRASEWTAQAPRPREGVERHPRANNRRARLREPAGQVERQELEIRQSEASRGLKLDGGH